MTREVRLSRPAERDLIRLNEFLAQRSATAARSAMGKIASSLRSLSDTADRGRRVGGKVRELPITFGRNGYVARYRVAGGIVTVTRIFHSREQR